MEKKITEEMLNNVWELFENQVDTDRDGVVEAVVYFVKVHGFDIEVLPEVLYDAVILKLLSRDRAEYYDNLLE